MNRGVKISILGAGRVGSTVAHTIAVQGLASQIVLVDIFKDKAKGEALDIRQGAAVMDMPVDVIAGDYADTVDSDIVIFTLGAARKPGQTRIDLAKGNVEIIESVIPEVVKYSPDAKYVVVSNPVDIITYTILKISGLPESQVIGTGCLLDTARLRDEVATYAQVSPKNIHLNVYGEHGATAMIPWSRGTIYGENIDKYFADRPELTWPSHEEILADVHGAGGKVIGLKGATFFAVSVVTAYVVDTILHDAKTVMPLSTMLHGQFGLDDVCISLPCVLGARGIEKVNTPIMSDEEIAEFIKSGNSLKEITAKLGL
ncbi:MAG: L-lactate dehydrogenase [Lachnospiraceae bacterium]|nr:L-lactate dehydrogenase [Lachnospiraceae bacterium]